MKKGFKTLFLGMALTFGMANVDAISYEKQIEKEYCDTVYTNYYFFLEANVTQYFKENVEEITINRATYANNYYQIKFDNNNIGYGVVDITNYTSSDGITTMSYNDFYTHFMKGGVYTQGTKTYFVDRSWTHFNDSNGLWQPGVATFSIAGMTKSELIKASIPAKITIDRQTAVNNTNTSPLVLEIHRQYGSVAGATPVTYNKNNYYLQPSLYYIQYCAPASEKEYTIIYDGNAKNVTNVPKTDIFGEDECTKISTKTPIREGYTFLGWSTNPNDKTGMSSYKPGKTYCGDDLVLYAIWEKNPSRLYSILYDGNADDAINVPEAEVFEEDECITISKIKPIRDGYTFLGWSTDKNAIYPMTKYNPGKAYCGGNMILYAVWQKNATAVVDTYTVIYDENTTDTVTNMPEDLTIRSTENVNISSLTPVREGYTFLGWSTDRNASSGNSSFAPGVLYTDKKDLVLYAIWKKNEVITPVLPENPQTGVMDYLVPFAGVGAISLLALSVLNKKKSFRQF